MAHLTAALAAPLALETAQLAEALRQSVVLVHDDRGHGAGVIWASAGLIVTNHHVVARDRAEVELADGRRMTATVAAREPDHDLAVLRVPARDLPAR